MSHAREMSTSGPSTPKVSPIKFAQTKEQMSKLMCMMQQLVIGGRQNSFSYSQGGPQIENENQPLPGQDQGYNTPPQGNDQETDSFKDKNPEFGNGQVKSQVQTLAKKLCVIEGSSAYGSVDLDSLTVGPVKLWG